MALKKSNQSLTSSARSTFSRHETMQTIVQGTTDSVKNGFESVAKSNDSTQDKPTNQIVCSQSQVTTEQPTNELRTPVKLFSQYEESLRALRENEHVARDINFGKRIGLYKIGAELGTGNFSNVRLATHVITRDTVALKTIDRKILDRKAQQLLAQEMDNLESVRNKHVIQLIEVIDTSTRVHLVLEYAGGGDLHSKITVGGIVHELKALRIYAQILSAVEYLHSNNIIHRDIKAENILYSSITSDFVKLADLGFSVKVETPEQKLTTFCGSPPWAAPELFNESQYEGFYVDIWALGILLYFLVTGRTPFMGNNISEIKRKVIDGEFTKPDSMSDSMDDLIRKILLQIPDERLSLREMRRHPWMLQRPSTPQSSDSDTLGGLNRNPNEIDEIEEIQSIEVDKSEVYEILMSEYGVPSEEMVRVVEEEHRFKHPIMGLYRLTEINLLNEKVAKWKEAKQAALSNGTKKGSASAEDEDRAMRAGYLCGLRTSICSIS